MSSLPNNSCNNVFNNNINEKVERKNLIETKTGHKSGKVKKKTPMSLPLEIGRKITTDYLNPRSLRSMASVAKGYRGFSNNSRLPPKNEGERENRIMNGQLGPRAKHSVKSMRMNKNTRTHMTRFLNNKNLASLEQTSSSYKNSVSHNKQKKRRWNRAGKKKLLAMEMNAAYEARRRKKWTNANGLLYEHPPIMRKLQDKARSVPRPDRRSALGMQRGIIMVSGAPRRLPKKDNAQVLSAVSAAEKNYYEDDESLSYRPGLRTSAAWTQNGHPHQNLFGPQRWDMNNKPLHKDRMKNPLGTIKKLNIGANHSALYKNIKGNNSGAGGETKTNRKTNKKKNNNKKNNNKKKNKKTKNNIMKNNKKTKNNNKYGCPKGKCTILGGRRKKTRKHIKRRKTRNNKKR